jgi:hypothetical protein
MDTSTIVRLLRTAADVMEADASENGHAAEPADGGQTIAGVSYQSYVITTDPVLLRQFWDTSEPPFRRLLKYLAERPDQTLLTKRVAQELGLPRGDRSLAGMLGAAGRRKTLGGTGYWPFRVRWSHAQGGRVIEMPGEVAAIIATF